MSSIEDLTPGDQIEIGGKEWTVISIKKDKSVAVLGSDRPKVEGQCWYQNEGTDQSQISLFDFMPTSECERFNGKVAKVLNPLDAQPIRILKGARTKHLDYPNGLNCDCCRELYNYAIPNQPDGKTLICYSCRENPIRRYY